MKTLLTVDDSRMIRRIVVQAGEVIGCDTIEAADGESALAILEKEWKNIGLVLLDWNMPGIDGLEVLKELKSDKRFADIPVMMVTTESEKENILKAIFQGADAYLTKPFAVEDLVTKINECLAAATRKESE